MVQCRCCLLCLQSRLKRALKWLIFVSLWPRFTPWWSEITGNAAIKFWHYLRLFTQLISNSLCSLIARHNVAPGGQNGKHMSIFGISWKTPCGTLSKRVLMRCLVEGTYQYEYISGHPVTPLLVLKWTIHAKIGGFNKISKFIFANFSMSPVLQVF